MPDLTEQDGTPERPFVSLHRMYPMKECTDPVHPADVDGTPIGRWFHPVMQKHSRCPICTHARPCKAVLRRMKQKAAGTLKPRKHKPRGEKQAFNTFSHRLELLRSEAAKLSDDPVLRSFGTYGKIRCLEREARLAQLDVAKDDGAAEFNAVELSIITGLPVGDVLAMRQGEGRQPRYPEMRAFYQIQDASKAHYARIRRMRADIARLSLATGISCEKCGQPYAIDPNKVLVLEGRLMDLEAKLYTLQPEPEKKAEIHFGDKDKQPPEQLAAERVVSMLLTEPPSPDSERLGGPGPLR